MRNHPETGRIAVLIDALCESDRRMWLDCIQAFAYSRRGSSPSDTEEAVAPPNPPPEPEHGGNVLELFPRGKP